MVVVRPAFDHRIDPKVRYGVILPSYKTPHNLNTEIKAFNRIELYGIIIPTIDLKWLYSVKDIKELRYEDADSYDNMYDFLMSSAVGEPIYVNQTATRNHELYNADDILKHILNRLNPADNYVFCRISGKEIIKFRAREVEHEIQ